MDLPMIIFYMPIDIKTHNYANLASIPWFLECNTHLNALLSCFSTHSARTVHFRVRHLIRTMIVTFQLYNEEVNDLLDPENKKLLIHESHESGNHVAGLHKEIVTSAKQVRALMKSGERKKHVALNQMNE